MYKVFLVDDEIVVRESIRSNIKWEDTQFIFSGEAPDGEMALPLIEEIKPDIVITDVKMPFMDGLELSRIVKKNMPWIKVIILSGHDEFEYAKEAIHIGVTDYLLKPINSGNLLKELGKVALQIEEEKKAREDLNNLKKQIAENIPLFKEKFLNELLLDLLSPGEAIERAAFFNINLVAKYYLVVIVDQEIKKYTNCQNEYSDCIKIETIVLDIVKTNPDIISFKRSLKEIVLIFKGDNPVELEDAAYRVSQAVKYEVERNTDNLLTIGIGNIKERIAGIAGSYTDANTARNFKNIFGKSKIIGINDIKLHDDGTEYRFQFCSSDIADFLKFGEKSGIQKFVTEYMECLNETASQAPIYVYYAFMDIVFTAARFVEELGGNVEMVIPEIRELMDILESANSLRDLAGKIEKILGAALGYRNSKKDNKHNDIISKAVEYIEQNYAEPNITLNSVADNVHVSPSHFSTIFSQETGETFIEYLIKTRIKKAKELLKGSNHKSSEIAYLVGYRDPHYFSYIFKKMVGITPTEFRNH